MADPNKHLSSTDRSGIFMARLIFWVVGLYSLAFLFSSMLSQLYGSPPALVESKLTAYGERWCVASAARLEVELDEQAIRALQRLNQAPNTDWPTYYHGDWLKRLGEAHRLCTHSADLSIGQAFDGLTRLGGLYDESVEAMTHGHTALRDDLARFVRNHASD